MVVCDHAAIKLDPARWESETEPLPGQVERTVIAGSERWWLMANCVHCKSSIAKPIEVELRP